MGIEHRALFEEGQFEIIQQENPKTNFAEAISRLPYVFKDPVKFDKKVDPRKLQFGSKIDNDSHRWKAKRKKVIARRPKADEAISIIRKA